MGNIVFLSTYIWFYIARPVEVLGGRAALHQHIALHCLQQFITFWHNQLIFI